MLELYSTNIEVDENAVIPLNTTKLSKGCTATLTSPASIQFNKRGVYMVSCNASITPTTAGTVSIQLAKDNTLQAGAVSQATGATGEINTLSFETLVQVPEDNTCSCYTAPTTVQFYNTGEAGTFSIVQVLVTKIC